MASTKKWSIAPWGRFDTEPPGLPARPMVTPDGGVWEVREPIPEAWRADHWHTGAQIHDSRRGITYRATVDAQGELDHLEVVLTEFSPKALIRLTSVPLAAIQREVNLQVIADREAGPDGLSFTPEGGVEGSSGNGGLYSPPSTQELVELLAAHPGWGRHEVARHYGRNVRTVDRWLREARKDEQVGHLMPPPTRTAPKETAEQLRSRLREATSTTATTKEEK